MDDSADSKIDGGTLRAGPEWRRRTTTVPRPDIIVDCKASMYADDTAIYYSSNDSETLELKL